MDTVLIVVFSLIAAAMFLIGILWDRGGDEDSEERKTGQKRDSHRFGEEKNGHTAAEKERK